MVQSFLWNVFCPTKQIFGWIWGEDDSLHSILQSQNTKKKKKNPPKLSVVLKNTIIICSADHCALKRDKSDRERLSTKKEEGEK